MSYKSTHPPLKLTAAAIALLAVGAALFFGAGMVVGRIHESLGGYGIIKSCLNVGSFHADKMEFKCAPAMDISFVGTGRAYTINGKWALCDSGDDVHESPTDSGGNKIVRAPQYDHLCQKLPRLPPRRSLTVSGGKPQGG